MARRASRLPTVITIAVILLVAAVVAVASLVANLEDTQVRAPAASEQPVPQITAQGDRIEFTTSDGSGQLVCSGTHGSAPGRYRYRQHLAVTSGSRWN